MALVVCDENLNQRFYIDLMDGNLLEPVGGNVQGSATPICVPVRHQRLCPPQSADVNPMGNILSWIEKDA